jgi:GNAT superfamily N-acetyltransferase
MRVRPARAEEAAALTELCIRSKAYWGYDPEFMRQAATALTVTSATIDNGRVLVAEDRDSGLLGIAAVGPMQSEGRFDLALLFVEPSAIGTGVGRTLFAAAVHLVRSQGGRSLSILADPFAAPFYQRMGAIEIGEAPSDAIAGRSLPLLEYAIPKPLASS